MRLPKLVAPQARRVTQHAFGGYRATEVIGEGEFSAMQNLSSRAYPALTTRVPRGRVKTVSNLSGLARYDTLCYVQGSSLVVNGYVVDMGLTLGGTPKKLTRMGAYLIILPDKRYINLQDLTDHGAIEADVSASAVTLTLSNESGEPLSNVVYAATPPAATDGVYPTWVDTSVAPYVMRVYSTATADYLPVGDTYLMLRAKGIGTPFFVGDAPLFQGLPEGLDGVHTLVACGADFLVIKAPPIGAINCDSLRVCRTMPEMDFICECGNRLFGCRYGAAADGTLVNELYASALGDFRNWHRFDGLSTDSYAAGVGSDGPFTGAVTYQGEPHFFKENFLHRISGAYPAAFRVTSVPCRGVAKGSDASLAVLGERLYYHAREGICAFDGAYPVLVSEALGSARYKNAAAGALGTRYYVSMYNMSTNGWEFLVFDAARGLWHREDSTHATCFCAVDGELYFGTATGTLYTVGGTSGTKEQKLPFFAETGPLGLDTPEDRYLSRLHAKLTLGDGARVRILAEYDGCGEFVELFSTRAQGTRAITALLLPRRCSFLRLRIEGEGACTLHSITRFEEKGGWSYV